MSVLIRGMEMPKSCRDCPCFCEELFYCHAKEGDNIGLENRPEDCPLVPVPPHGRLVSMDEIEERIDSCCDYIDCSKTMCNECAVQIVMNKVFDVPTIIPAEEEIADLCTKGHLHLGYAEEGE